MFNNCFWNTEFTDSRPGLNPSTLTDNLNGTFGSFPNFLNLSFLYKMRILIRGLEICVEGFRIELATYSSGLRMIAIIIKN